jgi:hypothetical protein
MRTYTVDDVVRSGACYRRKKIEFLWDDREAMSWQDIRQLNVPLADKVWFGTHAVLTSRVQRMAFDLECCRVCLRLVRHVDSRVLAALIVAERFHAGDVTDAELKQAHESLVLVPSGPDGVNEFVCAVSRTTSRMELHLLGGDNSWAVSRQAVAIQGYGAADIERHRQLAHITALAQEETE